MAELIHDTGKKSVANDEVIAAEDEVLENSMALAVLANNMDTFLDEKKPSKVNLIKADDIGHLAFEEFKEAMLTTRTLDNDRIKISKLTPADKGEKTVAIYNFEDNGGRLIIFRNKKVGELYCLLYSKENKTYNIYPNYDVIQGFNNRLKPFLELPKDMQNAGPSRGA